MTPEGLLRGKVALVTGASSGIGEATARCFAEAGALVAAVARHPENAASLRGLSGILPVAADVTQAADVSHMFRAAEQQLGPVDIVCNVAGINDAFYPLTETSDERWDRVLDLDLKSPFRICRVAVQGMLKRGAGGVLIHVGSYAAARGNHGPSYTAAKAGLVGLSNSIAVAYGDRGIRSNVINPGGVSGTGIQAGSADDEYHPAGFRRLLDIVGGIPLRRRCEPHEVAAVALFLASDLAGHLNGAVVPVDGGMSVA
jgi:NAD(P)-dependent dehydrogenase (short-subunit alcohol dehydrogenase family)